MAVKVVAVSRKVESAWVEVVNRGRTWVCLGLDKGQVCGKFCSESRKVNSWVNAKELHEIMRLMGVTYDFLCCCLHEEHSYAGLQSKPSLTGRVFHTWGRIRKASINSRDGGFDANNG